MDPSSVFGVAASMILFPEHQSAPRSAFSSNQNSQTLGIYAGNHFYNFPTTSKLLAYPSRPMVETQMAGMIGADLLPTGEMVVLAMMTMGSNQEDSLVFNEG